MKALLLQLWAMKPASVPSWLYAVLLLLVTLGVASVVSIGLWVLFTQIDYM